MASQAQIDANARNAARSTGPTSEAGRRASAANAIRHGLCGVGDLVRPEEAAVVEARAAEFADQMRPRNASSRLLVRRAAVLSVRLERCADREIEADAALATQAESEYQNHVEAEAEARFEALAASPWINLRRLLRTAAGVERLALAWTELREDLEAGSWTPGHGERLALLKGLRPADCHAAPLHQLTGALLGDDPSGQGRAAEVPAEHRPTRAKQQLLALIDEELADLRELRGTFDPAEEERDRLAYVAIARITPTPAMILHRKYEAAAERMMYRALDEARRADAAPSLSDQATQRGLEVVEAPPEPSSRTKLGSFPPGATRPTTGDRRIHDNGSHQPITAGPATPIHQARQDGPGLPVASWAN